MVKKKTSKKLKSVGRNSKPDNNNMDMDYILKNTTSYEDDLIEDLKDPDESRGYLEASLDLYEEDGDTEALLLVMRDVARAQGGMNKLCQHLRDVLADRPRHNPRLNHLLSILSGLGFRVPVKQREREAVAV